MRGCGEVLVAVGVALGPSTRQVWRAYDAKTGERMAEFRAAATLRIGSGVVSFIPSRPLLEWAAFSSTILAQVARTSCMTPALRSGS